jgi:hypothetical protein
MEIKELVSYYINETSKTLDITFKLISDGDDEVRIDHIDLDEVNSFGYNFNEFQSSDIYEEDDEDIDDLFGGFFDDYEYNETDEEDIITFLNEYYLVYPNKLPKSDFF